MDLIQSGLAYTINVKELGTFVVLDYLCLCTKHPSKAEIYSELSPRPVMYPVLNDFTRHPKDCALWAPYVEGALSPWGRGQMTVNAKYVSDNI